MGRRSIAVLVGSVALVSCGGSDSASDAIPTTTTTVAGSPTSGASSVPTVAPTTSPPTTAATQTTSAQTTTVSTTPPTPPPSGLSEDCLQGMWVLDAERTAALFGALLPGFPMTVDGSGSLEFDGDSVEHFLNIVVTFTIEDQVISGPYDARYEGTYTIDGDNLLIAVTTTEGGWGTLTAETPAGVFEVPVPPVGDVPPIAGGPATCDGRQLTLQYASGLAGAAAVFRRV